MSSAVSARAGQAPAVTDGSNIQVDTAVERSKPGLKAPKKVWWAKEITPDFQVAGRLSERQIKYAGEAGFRSILSLFTYEESSSFGGEALPTSAEAWHACHHSDMQYMALRGLYENWANVAAVEKLSDVMPKMDRPVLLLSNRGYASAFLTLMYLAKMTRTDESFTPRINSEKFYRITAAMGLDFTMNSFREIVATITGEPIVDGPPKPDTDSVEWYEYWPAHPVYKNWYTAGMIRDTHIPVLSAAGFKVVVNMRQGMTEDGRPSQEQVTLLNIEDGTPTYGNGSRGGRQTTETLETLVVDPMKESIHVSPEIPVNYESRNPGEFGDDIGYNEELERQAFELSTMKYAQMSIDSKGLYSKKLFDKYRYALLEAGKMGPVLVHCASAHRVAYMTVVAAALQYKKDLSWALKRVLELGFKVGPEYTPDVYQMFYDCLKEV